MKPTFTAEQARGFQRDVDRLVALFLLEESGRAAWTPVKVVAGELCLPLDLAEEAVANLIRGGTVERYAAAHPRLAVNAHTAATVRVREYRA
jgi:hypothetical protein